MQRVMTLLYGKIPRQVYHYGFFPPFWQVSLHFYPTGNVNYVLPNPIHKLLGLLCELLHQGT